MKNKIWIYPLLIMGLLILTNCKKDSDSTNLVKLTGTVWKSSVYPIDGIWTVKFIGERTVELSNTNEGSFGSGSYSLDGNNVSIVWDDYGTDRGVINDNTLTIYNLLGEVVVFTKQ